MKAGKANDVRLRVDGALCMPLATLTIMRIDGNVKQALRGVRESPQGRPFQRLEPCEGKLSCTVPRGLGAGNGPRLPYVLAGRYSKEIS